MGGKNRIVVDYGDYEGLVLLGAFDTKTGIEESRENLEKLDGFELVQKYDAIEDYTKLKEMIGNNAEGFVIRFSNGDRMKIKGEEYLRLHKIMTEISTKSVWECLSQGDDIYELLEDVPDEFFNKVEEYVDELTSQYMLLEAEYNWIFNKLRTIEDRAEFAQKTKSYKYPQLLFKMLDGKDYSETLWRIIKPEYKKL